jgi:hypothetical protein
MYSSLYIILEYKSEEENNGIVHTHTQLVYPFIWNAP